jgi:hypothetical protein
VNVPWKPGYKTTELLVVVLTNIGLILSSAADWLPPRYAAIGSAIASAAYAISRGLAKIYPAPVVPVVPQAGQAGVAVPAPVVAPSPTTPAQ